MGDRTTMSIVRRSLFGLAGAGAIGALSASLFAGGQAASPPPMRHEMPMAGKGGMKMTTKEQKIANAMSAAPGSVSARATVLDWPAKEGDAPTVLRQGTNGWTCLPDMAESDGNDPMCLDQPWMQWVEGYTMHKAPSVTRVGVGYMVAAGGAWGSNTDPYAMKATADNQWHVALPHLMIVVPDPTSLAGISTDPGNGGPYVMFAGTPYAHIMAPITAPAMTHQTMAR